VPLTPSQYCPQSPSPVQALGTGLPSTYCDMGHSTPGQSAAPTAYVVGAPASSGHTPGTPFMSAPFCTQSVAAVTQPVVPSCTCSLPAMTDERSGSAFG